MTKVCFQALPMPQFTTLQKRVFPLYFKLQTGLTVLVAVTHPPMSLVSLMNCWWDYVPLVVGLGVSALNLVFWGPRTQEVMIERIHQGERYNLISSSTMSSGGRLDCKDIQTRTLKKLHRGTFNG